MIFPKCTKAEPLARRSETNVSEVRLLCVLSLKKIIPHVLPRVNPEILFVSVGLLSEPVDYKIESTEKFLKKFQKSGTFKNNLRSNRHTRETQNQKMRIVSIGGFKMKKLFKPLALLGMAGAMAALTACAQLEANPSGQWEAMTLPGIIEPGDVATCEIPAPNFLTFSGTITEIQPYYTFTESGAEQVEGMKFIVVENDDDIIMFRIDLTTAVLLDGELYEGMQITGYYEESPAMIMIFPPQHRAVALVQAGQYNRLLDRFDENLVSFSGVHTLNITADTPIVFQDGQVFEGGLYELANRKLFVQFYEEGREITPAKVTILFELAVHPMHYFTEEELAELNLEPGDIIGGGADSGFGGPLLLCPEDVALMWNNMLSPEGATITVEGEVIDAPAPFVNAAAGTIMLPLAPIAEALGYTVVVEGNEVIIAPGTIVTEGVNSFFRGREMARELSAAPEMHDGVLFVPWEFFHEILNSAAFVDNGHIYVVSI